MKFLLVLLVSVATTSAVLVTEGILHDEWHAFKLRHKKEYAPHEEPFKKNVFFENWHYIAKHNLKYEMGHVKYKLELNQFADMLSYEMQTFKGFNKTSPRINNRYQNYRDDFIKATFIPPANVRLPDSVDWRDEGAVTPVKDQGHCGSCWAFSTTGALEGQNFRKSGVLVSLSEQNLIDCSSKYGNNGCDGGMMDFAFRYIKDNKGLDTEKSYPYEGHDDQCRYNPKSKGATDVGFVDIPQGDEEKLKIAVATVGPVSVAIDASHQTFQFYSEGVYSEPECSSENLDHGVLVVGYGTTEEGEDYWLVKNSWADIWGDKGYIKMARNKSNMCGIATSASYPLV